MKFNSKQIRIYLQTLQKYLGLVIKKVGTQECYVSANDVGHFVAPFSIYINIEQMEFMQHL